MKPPKNVRKEETTVNLKATPIRVTHEIEGNERMLISENINI